MQCRSTSTLELSLKSEQLILHTTWARTIKAMVEQFLSELKKASGCPALPGFPGAEGFKSRLLVLLGYWVEGRPGR